MYLLFLVFLKLPHGIVKQHWGSSAECRPPEGESYADDTHQLAQQIGQLNWLQAIRSAGPINRLVG